jgi:hypothetical protein
VPGLSVAQIAEAGAQRISVGGGLTRVAIDAMAAAATAILDSGDLSVLSARSPLWTKELTAATRARKIIQRHRLEVQPTEMVELPDEPGQGDPSGPAVIPEPYPPPDEGTPPEPAIIPEPGPLAPDEGPQKGRLRA